MPSRNATSTIPFGLLMALCLPIMVACIDVMALSIGIDSIAREFSASLNQAQWLLSGYTIGTAAFLITIGRLADKYGRRKLLLIGVILFALSSTTAAFSNTLPLLIISRFAQGVASSILMTTLISIITYQFPPEERGAMITKWAFACGLGLAIGPLVGGLLIYCINWRAIFLVNIPISLLSYYLILRYIPESKDETNQLKIDWLETGLLTTLLLIVTTLLSEGDILGWSSSIVMALSMAFFPAFILFAFVEYRKTQPLIDVSLFKLPNFTSAITCGFTSYFCMYAWLFLFGVYLQHPYGLTALEAGFVCASFSVAFAFGSKIVLKMMHSFSKRTFIQIGFLLAAIAFFGMSATTLQTSLWQLMGLFAILGTAITIINSISMTAATEHVPSHKAGIASGLIFTIRWLGGSLGIIGITIVYRGSTLSFSCLALAGIALIGLAVAAKLKLPRPTITLVSSEQNLNAG